MSDSPRTITSDQLQIPAGSGWTRLPAIAAAVGVVGIGISILLWRGDPGQFYFSWLVAFLYFLSLGLGALLFVLIHHATKAGWGVVVRRLAENTMAALPLFVLLGVPLVLGMHELFHWSDPEALAHDAILKGKEPYLNPTFFIIRGLIYFAAWSGLALAYSRGSRRQDAAGGEETTRRMIRWSGPAIALCAITVTFAGFDWIMSLDPHWYSTILGVYYFSGCLVGIFAFLIVLTLALERTGPFRNVISLEHYHDLGKLLFAFTVFWAYIAFAQFMLIWYGNIPEETVWYLHRQQGSWMTLTKFLAWGHFVIPFFFLMPRTIKRKRPLLLAGALWMLFMHLVDIHWLVMPVHQHHGFHPTLLDLTTLLGVGGLFLTAVLAALNRGAIVPIRDPRIRESLSFENI